jgi:casein kinase II subunit alpha
MAPKQRLENECRVLERVRSQPSIRQLIDTIQDPPSLVLRHLDDNLLSASNMKRLDKPDIKFVAQKILEALSALHQLGYVHTGRHLTNYLFTSLNCGS